MDNKIACFVIMLTVVGCSFLDENPRDQKTREEVVTSASTLYLNTLGNLYGMIGSDQEGEGLAGTCRGIYDLNTFTTDEAILPTRGGDWYDGGLWQRLNRHDWETGEAPVKNAWNYLYKVIVMANQAIADLKDYPEWQQEVRAVRAMYYYELLDLFGRVPIVTSPSVAMADVAQSERAEVFRFVKQELEDVLAYLSMEKSHQPGTYYGRITRPVAWFLLAKLCLNAPVYEGTQRYDEAVIWCDLLSEEYKLEEDYRANFAIFNERSQENIFTIPMDKHLYRAQNQYMFRSRHYDHAAAIGFSGENGSSATLEVLKANGFGTPEQDPRFDMNYWGGIPDGLDGEPIPGIEYKPWSIKLDVTGTPDEKTAGARMRKYEIDPSAMKDGKLMDNDLVLFRFADVLLMKAEALFRTGHTEDALALVNEVRTRADALPMEDITLESLLEERLREFAWEGLRRQDMVRFGVFDAKTYRNVFPIPADVLTLNPQLTQNEGY